MEASREEERIAGNGLLAAGGVLGALAASSCCVVPLVLSSFGVGAAWMSTVTTLAPYNAYIVVFTLVCLGMGFYLVYREPRTACIDGPTCARSIPSRIVKGSLWGAMFIILIALATKHAVPLVLGVS